MSFLAHLSARVSGGEAAFLSGRLSEADEAATDVLRDLASLMSQPGVSGPAARQLTPNAHQCAHGCVCRAAISLHMQCAAEMGRGPEAVDAIVTTYYGKTRHLPFNIFRLWIEYHLSLQHYEMCCRELISYIDAHYSTTPFALLSPSSAIEEDNSPAEGGSPDARYVALLELLLFHCLVPLGSHDEAIAFLRKGRKARRGGTAQHMRDERLAPEVKEAWMNELLDLQAAGYTHAVAAAKQLASADSRSAQVMPAAAFHEGLAALHEATAYTAAAHGRANSLAQQASLLLPPANLPEAGYTPLVHVPEGESSEGTTSHPISAADARSVELIPYPTLQPWLPAPLDPAFVWSAYVASLGHRCYAMLHRRWPRVANRLRVIAHWVWSRRGLWSGLVMLYLGLRLLAALLRYFRLADLPAIRILGQQMKNFVRIAFISGTGQSLFA